MARNKSKLLYSEEVDEDVIEDLKEANISVAKQEMEREMQKTHSMELEKNQQRELFLEVEVSSLRTQLNRIVSERDELGRKVEQLLKDKDAQKKRERDLQESFQAEVAELRQRLIESSIKLDNAISKKPLSSHGRAASASSLPSPSRPGRLYVGEQEVRERERGIDAYSYPLPSPTALERKSGEDGEYRGVINPLSPASSISDIAEFSEDTVSAALSSLSSLRSKNKTLKAELKRTKAELETSHKYQQQLFSDLQETTEKLQSQHNELDTLQQICKVLEERSVETREEQTFLKAELSVVQEELEDALAERERAIRSLEEKEVIIDTLEMEVASYEGEMRGMKVLKEELEAKSSLLLEHKQTNEETMACLHELESTVSSLSLSLEDVSAERDLYMEKHDRLAAIVMNSEQKFVSEGTSLKEELRTSKEKLADACEERDRLKRERDELKEEVLILNSQVNSLVKSNEKLAAEGQSIELQLVACQHQLMRVSMAVGDFIPGSGSDQEEEEEEENRRVVVMH